MPFDFTKELLKNNEFGSIASDGIIAGDFDGFFDSGSYSLNALLSGSIYGGYPKGKITALAGPSGVGKTFFVLTAMRLFLEINSTGGIILFESESALSKSMLEEFNIDTKRVVVLPVDTVEAMRYQCLNVLNNYEKSKKKPPMLIALDSLGMLSTEKEINDITDGKSTRDMTRAQLVKGAFRVLTLKTGKIGVPILLTNHTYQEMGLFPKTIMSGGSGLQYAASTVVFLGKKQDKDGTERVGSIIPCRLGKGRLTKEFSVTETAINYETGLNRWHGMIEFALECGVWQRSGTRILMLCGEKIFAKQINKNPEKYFTECVMELIDEHCKNKFLYGSAKEEDYDYNENGEADTPKTK